VAGEGVVTATDGRDIPMRIATLCVHGDTPGAAALARGLREGLARSGDRR
jgi:5-oxoprolinase (ATP-hydrolysing) subunit A